MKAIYLWLNLTIVAGNDVNIENGLLLVAKFLTAAAFHSHHRFFCRNQYTDATIFGAWNLNAAAFLLHVFSWWWILMIIIFVMHSQETNLMYILICSGFTSMSTPTSAIKVD